MNAYVSILKRLYALEPRGITLGLERMHRALDILGHPEQGQNYIHVAGTNGKGSVCAMLHQIASHQGLKAGLFTSPHLHHLTERIRVGHSEIEEKIFVELADQVLTVTEAHQISVSFFESMTLIGLLAFRSAECDISIIEVGLGGRLDSTNVVTPRLSVITEIGMDHTDRLGNTLRAIAQEKAGIIKMNVPVVVGINAPEVIEVFAAKAKEESAEIFFVEATQTLPNVPSAPWITPHQKRNMLTAQCAAQRMGWSAQAIRQGIESTHWPGRFEFVTPARTLTPSPTYLLDGAHNMEGCIALVQSLSVDRNLQSRNPQPRVLIFAAMQDKPIEAMLKILESAVSHTVLVPLSYPRAFDPRTWITPRRSIAKNAIDALNNANLLAGPDGLVIVAGSLYLVGECRGHLLNIESDPPIQL